MKSKLCNQKQQPALTYPVLMQSRTNKQVVLFTDATTGTVVSVGNTTDYQIGYRPEGWVEATNSVWERYEGAVKLSND